MTQEELLADSEALAGLRPRTDLAPDVVKRSLAHAMSFPLQEHKVSSGKEMEDPESGAAREHPRAR